MNSPDVDTGYEPYSEDPDYIAVNRALVNSIDLDGVERVADLACGTGLLCGLLIERKPSLAVCGIDLDPHQIEIARRKLAAHCRIADDLAEWRASGAGAAHLRVENVEQLPFADCEIDLVLMGNAIHLIADRASFLVEARRVLVPGGALAFNSVFFVGTFAAGTEPLYTEWLKQALARLEQMNQERARQGLPPVPRRRGQVGPAFSKGWLSPEVWQAELEEAGFRVELNSKRETRITRNGLKLVGAYGGLAKVLMSGYPVEVSSVCLQAGAEAAFDALGLTEVPRYWLEMTAVRI
jgi:ubiquinone/menaquinone biosynthesis C-methylase UbiE